MKKLQQQTVAAAGTEGQTKRAVVYGYGGVTNVVVHVLKKLGYTVALTGRRLHEAERRAKELGATVFRPGDQTTFQLLVNAAPVTDRPLDQAAGLLDALAMVSKEGDGCAFDHEMPGANLKAHCEENNIHHIDGKQMYYPQMYRQVRKTPSWSRCWANFSRLLLYSDRNAWASLDILGQSDTFLTPVGALLGEYGRDEGGRAGAHRAGRRPHAVTERL